MIKTAYLRVYQPLDAFTAEERMRWLSEPGEGEPIDPVVSRRWLVSASMPAVEATAVTETAFVRRLEEGVYVCPWRTRFRMLSGLVEFRGAVPAEVADAFVPEAVARTAARELGELARDDPDVRSHILHANWHVPLRWFAAFDDSERTLVEDKQGLRIRYETELEAAYARTERALEILSAAGMESGVVEPVRDLLLWLEEFGDHGLVELDYASVAALVEPDDLVEDRSVRDVWACLEALEAGDLLRAGRLFGPLIDRWNGMRSREVVN